MMKFRTNQPGVIPAVSRSAIAKNTVFVSRTPGKSMIAIDPVGENIKKCRVVS